MRNSRPTFVLLICGLLMALGWAINGMIGNAPGAAIPGVFIAMAVAGILGLIREGTGRRAPTAHVLMRIAAFGAMGFWFGGEMTYGQTFGLMRMDVAGGAHYWWGLLGVAIKGAAWSGVGAAFIGLGLMCKRYRWQEVSLLLAAMTVASIAGLFLFNRPNGLSGNLPLIRFSYDPAHPTAPGRTECWGAIWAGFIVLLAYARAIKKDHLTFRFGVFGILGGGLGFSIGQMIQAFSWAHPGIALRPWIDWWKVMEMTHGFIVGVFIALAALVTRREEISIRDSQTKPFSSVAEWSGIIVWLLLVLGYFIPYPRTPIFDDPMGTFLAVFPFLSGILVFAGLTAGRWWPWIIVGVQVPLSTGLISANGGMGTSPYPTGYKTPSGEMISLFEVLKYAWPMALLAVLVCAIPMYIWLYRRPQQVSVSGSIIRVFIGYHLIAVLIQMVWTTLHFAQSWSFVDLFLYARPFLTLTTAYLLCWGAAMRWFPGGHRVYQPVGS